MNLLEQFKPIRYFIFDIEGVLTDGTLFVSGQGAAGHQLWSRDLYAIEKAAAAGFRLIFISEYAAGGMVEHLGQCGVTDIYTGVKNKLQLLHTLTADLSATLYMGDDIPDLAAMKACAMAACPNNAVAEIRETAAYISPAPAGRGCVRDVLEKVLKLNGNW